MKLYITEGSPYARLTRIVVLEKSLQDRVEILIAHTRAANSPYYSINPSGRVPYLVRDDGVGLEESALIVDYLDHLDGKPIFAVPPGEPGWQARRLEAQARSLLDGVAVWNRELRRPEHERSPTIVHHETDRAARLTDRWETEIAHPWMAAPLNLSQLTLACALALESRNPHFRWRPNHPNLSTWFDRLASRPSLSATAPKSGAGS